LDLQKIVADLKEEMERIGTAIGLLEQSGVVKKRRGRKPGSTNSATAATAPTSASTKAKRRGLTPAGRKRLSELMKKRWADRRKKQA
jgi:hypothetical protein